MCFSATASFASSAVLVTIGTITMRRARTAPQKFMALMPLLFAFQQFAEGVVWLSVINSAFAGWRNIAMYSFLIFAQLVWPLYVPFAVLWLEKDEKKKKVLKWFAASGIVATTFFLYCVTCFKADIVVTNYHIQYQLDFPFYKMWFYGIIYFIPAFIPTFFSGFKKMRLLGGLLLASYLVSRFWYMDYIVSVWCFFGALSSITVLYIIKEATATESYSSQSINNEYAGG